MVCFRRILQIQQATFCQYFSGIFVAEYSSANNAVSVMILVRSCNHTHEFWDLNAGRLWMQVARSFMLEVFQNLIVRLAKHDSLKEQAETGQQG